MGARSSEGESGHRSPRRPSRSGNCRDFRSDLRRFSKDRLFRGIRVGGSKMSLDDMRALADADLSLDAIGNATIVPALLALTDQVPNLRVIINHMPVEPSGWQANGEMRELAKRPQVYCEGLGSAEEGHAGKHGSVQAGAR